MRHALVTVMALLLVSSGCSTQPRDDGVPEGYRPVPDRELFAAIEDLPGYKSGGIGWTDNLTQGRSYVGRLAWRRDAEDTSRQAARKVIEILRHGRYEVDIAFSVIKPGSDGTISLDLASGQAELTRVFGEQTGQTGWPPAFVSE